MLPVAVVDPGPVLAGLLDEQRHPHDPGGVVAADHPRVGARLEADAVVGGDHHQGPVVQAAGPQAGQHLAEQPVGPGQLEAVALGGQPGPGRLVPPGGPPGGQAEGAGRLGVAQPGRQRPPRAVGQEQVQVVQPRGGRRWVGGQPLPELGEAGRPGGRRPGGARGRGGRHHRLLELGGDLLLALPGGDQLGHQGAAAAQGPPRPGPGRPAGGRPLGAGVAAPPRAQHGRGLVHVQPVGAVEQGEQVVGVAAVVRGQGPAGVAAGEHGREGVAGPLGHGGGVAVPGRAPGQPGEARVGGRVDPPAGVQQRGQGQLVEGDDHDRGPAGRRLARRGRAGDRVVAVGQDQGRGRGGEQEHGRGQQRRRGGHPQHPGQRRQPAVEGGPGPGGQGGGHGQGQAPQRRQVPAHLHRQGGQEPGHHGQVGGPAGPGAGQPGQGPGGRQGQRRGQGDHRRQEDQVGGVQALQDEEVGAVAEHVEGGQGDGQTTQAGQLQQQRQLAADGGTVHATKTPATRRPVSRAAGCGRSVTSRTAGRGTLGRIAAAGAAP